MTTRRSEHPFGTPNSFARQFEFGDDAHEWRRRFAETLGTFLLVLGAAGAQMVNARFGGHAVDPTARALVPALTVGVVILFMGAVSGAHLNPAVTLAFALRRDFPWRRVPGYLIAQAAGSVAAMALLVALVGRHGQAGLTLPGPGVSNVVAMIWEIILTAGLVTTILGASSGAQSIGPFAALAVGGYLAMAGLWGAPMSGASMNPFRSLAPLVFLDPRPAWWIYLIGPTGGSLIAVVIASVLRGPGGGPVATKAAGGTA
jgi:aquaporin Z